MPVKKKPGRPAGAPNILTSQLRDLVKDLVRLELDQVQKLLSQCPLEKRVALVAKLGTLLIPRQTEEEAKNEEMSDEVQIISIGPRLPDDKDDEPKAPAQPKDKPKKLIGRPKGSLNKSNRDNTERLKTIFVMEYYYVRDRLDELSPEMRLDFLFKMARLTVPKQSEKNDINKNASRIITMD